MPFVLLRDSFDLGGLGRRALPAHRELAGRPPGLPNRLEIESAVVALPRAQQTKLLHFVSTHLGQTASPAAAPTGAELAQLWPALPHLTEDEAAAFEHDLAVDRATFGGAEAARLVFIGASGKLRP